MAECIFCKIIKKELPSEILFENNELVAISDINPKAPVHILVLSKAHIVSIKEIDEQSVVLVAQMALLAKKIAETKNIKGYKLVFNVGREGGQVIDHLHMHFLGGWNQEMHKVEV